MRDGGFGVQGFWVLGFQGSEVRVSGYRVDKGLGFGGLGFLSFDLGVKNFRLESFRLLRRHWATSLWRSRPRPRGFTSIP